MKSLSYLPNVFVCYCEIVKEEWSLNPYHIFQIALPGSLIARQHRWYKYAVLWQQHNIRYLQFVLPSDLILLLNKLVPKKSFSKVGLMPLLEHQSHPQMHCAFFAKDPKPTTATFMKSCTDKIVRFSWFYLCNFQENINFEKNKNTPILRKVLKIFVLPIPFPLGMR